MRIPPVDGAGGRSAPESASTPAPMDGGMTRDVSGALAGAIRVVSGLTLFSRFAGLARDVVMVRLLGDGALASAFRIGYTFPNLFRRLFGEGALSAAFLPEYTRLRREDPGTAQELCRLTMRLLTLVTSVLTLVIILGLLAVLALAPAQSERTTTILLIILMLPMMPMVCITAILGGVLQAHGRFGPPAAAPILLNIFQIGAGLPFFFVGPQYHVLAAYVVGASAVLASAVQIVWSVRALRGHVQWRRGGEATRAAAVEHGRGVFKRFLPAVLGLGTLQLNTMLDQVIATWPMLVGPTMFGRPVPLDEKSNAILSYTQQLYQFPLGVFGIAVATAVFPLLSRAAAVNAPVGEFADVLRRGLRLSFFIGLPASIGLVLVRHDLIYVVYSGGGTGFSADGVTRAALVLLGFAPAVWAYSLNHVLTRGYYAKQNTSTPMRIAVAMVLLNIVLNFVLIWPLREAGLAFATAISSVVQCGVLIALAPRLLGVSPFDSATARGFVRTGICALVMTAAVYGVLTAVRTVTDASYVHSALRVLVGVVVGGASFAACAVVLRLPELRWLTQRAPKGAGAEVGFGD